MSRQRRNFSAKFKSDLIIELLKWEKDLNTLATENNIQPKAAAGQKMDNKLSIIYQKNCYMNLAGVFPVTH